MYNWGAGCPSGLRAHRMYKIYKNIQKCKKFTKINAACPSGLRTHRMYKNIQKCTKVCKNIQLGCWMTIGPKGLAGIT